MADADSTEKKLTGCGLAVLSLFVMTPMWSALCFGVLQKIDADPWMWVLFWCYLPVMFIAQILGQVFSKFMK